MKRSWMILAPMALLCASVQAPLAVAGDIAIIQEVVAVGCGNTQCVNGEPAPDGNGKLYDVTSRPSINRFGQVAFSARLIQTAGGFNTDDTGIFTATTAPGSLRQIVRAGEQAPNANGNFTSPFTDVPINDAGEVAFCGELKGTFGGFDDNAGYFRGDGAPGSLAEILRGGGGSCPPFAFSENGEIAFLATDISLGTGDPFTKVVRGQPAPDGDGTFIVFYTPALNDAGQVAFRADVGSDRHPGIFRGDTSAVVQIARAGDASPDGNGTFSSFTNPAINNAGDVAFPANLIGTNGASADNQGVYISRGNSLITIARRGQPAPDGNGRFLDLAGAHFQDFDTVAINEAGQVAFRATFTGTAGSGAPEGLLRGDGTTLKQIARVGDLVPDGVSRIKSLGYPALNDAGQVAFYAELVRGAEPVETAIFLYDDTLGLLQMFRGGDSLLGSQIRKDLAILFQPSITFYGKKRSGLNESGQVASSFFLNDGRTILAIASVGTDSFSCTGDCDGSNMVDVGEILKLVNYALGTSIDVDCAMCRHGIPANLVCPSGVTVSEILQAVNIALGTSPCTS